MLQLVTVCKQIVQTKVSVLMQLLYPSHSYYSKFVTNFKEDSYLNNLTWNIFSEADFSFQFLYGEKSTALGLYLG